MFLLLLLVLLLLLLCCCCCCCVCVLPLSQFVESLQSELSRLQTDAQVRGGCG